MASIFAGVPFITQLPERPNLRNLGELFIGGFNAGQRAKSHRQNLAENQRQFDQGLAERKRQFDLMFALKVQEAEAEKALQNSLLQSRRMGMADRALFAEAVPSLSRDPENAVAPDFSTIGAFERWEKLKTQAIERKLDVQNERVKQQGLIRQLEAGVVPGLTGAANNIMVAENLRTRAMEIEQTEGPTANSRRYRSVADRIERSGLGGAGRSLTAQQKAELSLAEDEFNARTAGLSPDSAAYKQAKQEYLKTIERLSPAFESSGGFDTLEQFGVTPDLFQERLGNAMRLWKSTSE